MKVRFWKAVGRPPAPSTWLTDARLFVEVIGGDDVRSLFHPDNVNDASHAALVNGRGLLDRILRKP